MNDFEIVAGVFAAVFILGIGMGVIMVIAMSALRRHRDHRQHDDQHRESGSWYGQAPPWKVPPEDHHPGPPRWPNGGGFQD